MVSASQCPAAVEAQALSLPTTTGGVELGQPRHRKRALIRALRLFLITGTCCTGATSTQLSEFPAWPREKCWNMCTPNWAGRPGDSFTSPEYAATITRRQETHQQDEPARRTGDKPAARFKSGAIIVRAALSLVAWLNCSTQQSVVEPMRCACRGHK